MAKLETLENSDRLIIKGRFWRNGPGRCSVCLEHARRTIEIQTHHMVSEPTAEDPRHRTPWPRYTVICSGCLEEMHGLQGD
jgi:hypothetical protein